MKQISLSSRALKMAHILNKNKPGFKWSDVVRHAWYFVRFRQMLRKSIMIFSYYKKDGSIREARGTLSELIIPHDVLEKIKGQNEPNFSVITYWDIDTHDWRCFRITDFIGFVSIFQIEEVKNKIL